MTKTVLFASYAVPTVQRNGMRLTSVKNSMRSIRLPRNAMSLLTVLIAMLFSSQALAGDWPQWRGTNRNAVSNEKGLLASWSGKPPALAWHVNGIGDGYSSVVVAERLVFTTGKIGNDVFCFALEADSGIKRWSTKIGETSRNVMSTPTVHDGLVHALDPDGELICLNAADGKIIWQRSFTDDFAGRLMSGRGYGESPLIDGDRLICTPGGKEAMMVALNRKTGELIWKSTLPDIGKKGRDGAAFSSIAISEAAGIRQYVQLTGRGLIGVAAISGRFLWGYNDISNQTANIPTPIVKGDMVFSANGYHAGSVLLRLEQTDDKTGVVAREVYRLKGHLFQNHHGGFVLLGNHVYGGHGSNNGVPTCLDFKTGKIVWKRRGPGIGSAAVIAADGRLYFRYQNGVVALIKATPTEYRLQGKFKVPGAGVDSWSHPVIANGKLFLREKDNLWVYDIRNNQAETQPAESPRNLTPELAALRQRHVKVQQLETRQVIEQRNRLYLFAINDKEKQLNLIALTDRHVARDGTIDATILALLQKLETSFVLSLAGTRIERDGLKQVSSLKSLVGLNLELCGQISDDDWGLLSAAKRLRVLVAAGTSVSERGLQALTNSLSLVAIDLEACDRVTDSACLSLGKLKQLRAINLRKTGFEKLRITSAGLQHLTKMSHIEVLNLSGNSVTNDGLQHLKQMNHLRELDLSLMKITDDGLTHLLPLKKLKRLDLVYSEGFAGPIITNVGIKSLATLSKLNNLKLVGARITDDSIDDLSTMQQLTQLSVINSRISSSGISRLERALPGCQIVSEVRTKQSDTTK